MEIEGKHYLTSDVKIHSFLQMMQPDLFVGINRGDNRKVTFVYLKNRKLIELARGYSLRKKYLISPLDLMNSLNQAKSLIFGDYQI